MALIGYVRCSTDKQTIAQQIDALRAAGCDRIYRDKFVRATARVRPGLRAVRKILKPGDTFVVSAIDRAFRSTIEAITFLDEIGADGVSFRSLTQQIDPRTPEGRKWYIDSANSAEYERAVISRRTREAMAAKMRRGRKFGRPRKMTKKRTAYALEKLAADPSLTVAALAKKMKISPRTLKRAIARHRPDQPSSG